MNSGANPAGVCRTEIVVPTLAETHRGPQLLRAIDSIESQGGRALVVINGSRFDPSLKTQLEALPHIRLILVAEPGLPNAIQVGCRAVSTRYFGFLDDDDYLLPGSIALREGFLESHPEFDAVVTNGLREEWGADQQLYKSPAALERIAQDPMAALLEANWMTPCGVLYRAASVPAEVFLNLTKYAEWTDVGFRLIDQYRFGFLFDNTFVQTDTPGSLSKQAGQARFILGLHKRIAGKLKTATHHRLWDQRVCRLHHQIAEDELAANNRGEALRHHLYSLLHAPSIGFPRYLSYTRKFFL
jgi:glycosyltransferase involved in cell wall biosynthesis